MTFIVPDLIITVMRATVVHMKCDAAATNYNKLNTPSHSVEEAELQ